MSRRTEIRAAAIELVAAMGADRVTVRQVASHSYLSASGIYRHYRGIDELLVECRGQLLGDVAAACVSSAEPVRAVVAWAEMHPGLGELAFSNDADAGAVAAPVSAFVASLGGSAGSEIEDRRLFAGFCHVCSIQGGGAAPLSEHVEGLLRLDALTREAGRADIDRWFARETHHELLETVVERALSTKLDPVMGAILDIAATTGRFPSRREVAARLGRSVSALYPVVKGDSPTNDVRRLLTTELAPVLLAGAGTPIERFWDFLIKAGVLGLQYPALIRLVATKPHGGRSALESHVIELLADDRQLVVPPEAFASYILGNVIDYVRHQPCAFPEHFGWLAAAFAAASASTP